jgi:hypothetical protein
MPERFEVFCFLPWTTTVVTKRFCRASTAHLPSPQGLTKLLSDGIIDWTKAAWDKRSVHTVEGKELKN